MAFVFRSQKTSQFSHQPRNKLISKGAQQSHESENSTKTLSNQQSQLNGNSFHNSPKNNDNKNKVAKGLPSLLRDRHNKLYTQEQSLIGCRQSQDARSESKENINKLTSRLLDKQNNKEKGVKNSLINLQKLQKQSSNYFFSSKVVREPYGLGDPLKQLSCNLTHSTNFNRNLNEERSGICITDNKNSNASAFNTSVKQTTLANGFVNKNLLQTANELKHSFKKPTIGSQQNSQELDKLMIQNSLKTINKKQLDNSMNKTGIKNSPPKDYRHNKRNISNFTTLNYHQKYSKLSKSIDQNQGVLAEERPTIKDQKQNHQNASNISLNNNKVDQKSILETVGSTQKNKNKRSSQLKKGKLLSSFYKESSSQQQPPSEEQSQAGHSSSINPGPGAYSNSHINLKQKKSFRSQKEKFSKIFVSPLKRFNQQMIKYHQVTFVNEQTIIKQVQKQNKSFLSRTPKFMPMQKSKSQFPSPGNYNIRQSIQHDVVRNLLRNANVANFSSTVPRFNYKSQNKLKFPGPGHYQLDNYQNARKEEMNSILSCSYKSQVKRCQQDKIKEDGQMNRTELDLLVDKQKPRAVIHKRDEHFQDSQFFTAPPFMSGVSRFENQTTQNNCEQYQHSISSINNSPKNAKDASTSKQPFNSTSSRQMNENIGQGIGVGSYNLNKDSWNKRSYNVYFH